MKRSPAIGVQPVVITGGAGFIGANLAHALASIGRSVLLYDNLSRKGVEQNVRWLKETHGDLVMLREGDIRDFPRLASVIRQASFVYHLAAQVAVTTSLTCPSVDFAINAQGTLNVLEALRTSPHPVPILYTSTNKVYGSLTDIELRREGERYVPVDPVKRGRGISEHRTLEFHSPYGCSKGTADQYVLDYARVYGLKTVVFRMSCIYGPHQFGNEDQGWISHFLVNAHERKPLFIYGDGCQVRDALYVDDLIAAFFAAEREIDSLSGQAFNVGGGPDHVLSLLELCDLIREAGLILPEVHHERWRPGDQRYYVTDTSKFRGATGWTPEIPIREGIRRLNAWIEETSGAPTMLTEAA